MALVILVIGFAGGFALRPVIAPVGPSAPIEMPLPVALTAAEARSVQYFMTHLDEARQVVAGCRDGAMRGDECGNAETAIIRSDAAERRKRFLGN